MTPTAPRLNRLLVLLQSVLVRVFGEKTEVLIDRERDNGVCLRDASLALIAVTCSCVA